MVYRLFDRIDVETAQSDLSLTLLEELQKKEMHRAILDKEAAGIVFGFKKYYDYIFGRKIIILRTDHEPVKRIIGPKIGIPLMATRRLQR